MRRVGLGIGLVVLGSATPATADQPRVAQVAVGPGGRCVLSEDGRVVCWGDGYAFDVEGQVGMDPHRVAAPKATAISVGRHHACALDGEGRVFCAGRDQVSGAARGGYVERPADMPDPGAVKWNQVTAIPASKQLASGEHHACALTKKGDVWCWGFPGASRLGHRKGSRPAAVPGLGTTRAIAVASTASCALGTDRQIRCFGNLATKDDAPNPSKGVTAVGLPPAIDLGVGTHFVCGLAPDRKTAHCFGYRAWRKDDGKQVRSLSLPEPAKALVSGAADVCFVGETSGKLWCNGGSAALIARSGKVDATKWRAYAQPGRSFAMHWHEVCAVTEAGRVACAGTRERLPDAPDRMQRTPVAVVGLSGVTQIDAGNDHACARKSDGTVWCWGGSWEDPAVPRRVAKVKGATSLHVGYDASCARSRDGALSCWNPEQYQNHPGPRIPEPALGKASEVAVGANHACAITAGTVSCWGANYQGQLGFISPEEYPKPIDSPRLVAGIDDAVSLDAGAGITCAARRNGKVACWGNNEEGLLGRGTASKREGIGDVKRLTGASRVSLRSPLSCALTTKGEAWCWGDGALTPVRWPGASDIVDVSAGRRGHDDRTTGTCIVRSNGSVECGKPGSARRIKGLDEAKAVASGDGFACALLRDGTVRCWGKREHGQLGDGKAPVTTELRVLGLPW